MIMAMCSDNQENNRMTKKSLLEVAIGSHVNHSNKLEFTDDELELVQGWLDDTVGISQVAIAINKQTSQQCYSFLARGCKKLYQSSK
jgi:hypothetical protein